MPATTKSNLVVFYIVIALAIIGAINELSVGLLQEDLPDSAFGHGTPISRLLHILYGICGLLVSFVYYKRVLSAGIGY